MIWICREGYEEMAETWEGKKKAIGIKQHDLIYPEDRGWDEAGNGKMYLS